MGVDFEDIILQITNLQCLYFMMLSVVIESRMIELVVLSLLSPVQISLSVLHYS